MSTILKDRDDQKNRPPISWREVKDLFYPATQDLFRAANTSHWHTETFMFYGTTAGPGALTIFAGDRPASSSQTVFTGATIYEPAVFVAHKTITSPAVESAEYNPELVERLLRLDSEAPEATFHNVIDMMDWLDRD
jgi:hypothetical protein